MRLPLLLILFLPAIGTAEPLRVFASLIAVDPLAPGYTENLREVAQVSVKVLEP